MKKNVKLNENTAAFTDLRKYGGWHGGAVNGRIRENPNEQSIHRLLSRREFIQRDASLRGF